MTPVQTLGQVVSTSVIDIWSKFISYVPTLIGALLVFLFGIIAASIVGKIVERIVKVLKVDQAILRISGEEKLEKRGIKIVFSVFLGQLVKWFLILVFLMTAVDVLELDQVTALLNSILLYLPNVIVAIIILTIAFLLGNLVNSIVRSSSHIAKIISATLLAGIARWAVIIFGILAALIQLGIAVSLVNTIFIGLVASVSLATGLAFGLGGKDEAALILRKIREEIVEKR
jgi:hypothetical protein